MREIKLHLMTNMIRHKISRSNTIVDLCFFYPQTTNAAPTYLLRLITAEDRRGCHRHRLNDDINSSACISVIDLGLYSTANWKRTCAAVVR